MTSPNPMTTGLIAACLILGSCNDSDSSDDPVDATNEPQSTDVDASDVEEDGSSASDGNTEAATESGVSSDSTPEATDSAEATDSPTDSGETGVTEEPPASGDAGDAQVEETDNASETDTAATDADAPDGSAPSGPRPGSSPTDPVGTGTNYEDPDAVAALDDAAPKEPDACADVSCPQDTMCYTVREGTTLEGITVSHRCVPFLEDCDWFTRTCECLVVDPCELPFVCVGFSDLYNEDALGDPFIACGQPPDPEPDPIPDPTPPDQPPPDCNTPNCL